MQTFFKIIGALSVLAGLAYLIYRAYEHKCSSEFLFDRCDCCDDDDDCQCVCEACDCEEDDTIYFDDVDYGTEFASEKISSDDFMTEEEIKNQDNNDENEEF